MVAIPACGGRVAHMLTVKLKSFDGVDQTERERGGGRKRQIEAAKTPFSGV